MDKDVLIEQRQGRGERRGSADGREEGLQQEEEEQGREEEEGGGRGAGHDDGDGEVF